MMLKQSLSLCTCPYYLLVLVRTGTTNQFLLVFPCWGLLYLFVRVELHISLLGVYYTSPFLGKYIEEADVTNYNTKAHEWIR